MNGTLVPTAARAQWASDSADALCLLQYPQWLEGSSPPRECGAAAARDGNRIKSCSYVVFALPAQGRACKQYRRNKFKKEMHLQSENQSSWISNCVKKFRGLFSPLNWYYSPRFIEWKHMLKYNYSTTQTNFTSQPYTWNTLFPPRWWLCDFFAWAFLQEIINHCSWRWHF